MPGEVEAGLPWRKIAVLAVVAVVLLTVINLSPLRHYLGHLQDLSDRIRGLGWMAPLALMLGVAVLVAVGFPRLALCVVAGMALGFWSGLLWAQLGTLLGNYATFLAVRAGSGDWAQHYLSRRGRLRNLIRLEGISGVILARQLPLPGLVVNLALGVFPIRHRDFVIGTIIGQLPQAIPCTLIGAGAVAASFAGSVGVIGLAVIVAVLAWLGLRWWVRRQRPAVAQSATS
jgi:uncharacterized membrane protein YdjX (TVP38/TMEM64 family)